MAIFAILYTYDDRSAGRDEHRPVHRAYLDTLRSRGLIVANGPYDDDLTPGALLIGRADSAAELTTALDQDPFYLEGLIVDRQIRPWIQVKRPLGAVENT